MLIQQRDWKEDPANATFFSFTHSDPLDWGPRTGCSDIEGRGSDRRCIRCVNKNRSISYCIIPSRLPYHWFSVGDVFIKGFFLLFSLKRCISSRLNKHIDWIFTSLNICEALSCFWNLPISQHFLVWRVKSIHDSFLPPAVHRHFALSSWQKYCIYLYHACTSVLSVFTYMYNIW